MAIELTWYDGFIRVNGKEIIIPVTQAMYGQHAVPNVWISKDLKLYWASPLFVRGARLLRPIAISQGGYPHIRRRVDGAMKNYRVHRIVACTFLPIDKQESIRGVPAKILEAAKQDIESLVYLYNSLQVNHINHIRTNYSVENLEWCTAQENTNAYHQHAGFDAIRAEKKIYGNRHRQKESNIKVVSLDKEFIKHFRNSELIILRTSKNGIDTGRRRHSR